MSGVTYHQVQQGSPEWLALRATHYTASEAPAMMGVSPYQSRSELLRAKNTGLAAEVDAHTQRRFDDGHRAEAAARPLAEAIIKDDLYPATVSAVIEDLPILASLDGMTMDGKILFEHKLWNEALAEAIRDGDPAHHEWQLEQQLLVTGAEKVLFMTSDGTEERCAWMWYESRDDKAKKLIQGWKQFRTDERTYTPTESAPIVTGKAPETLPALRIEVQGMVTASNLAEFKETALGLIHAVNTDLSTDQDFADAEKAVKWCSEVESRLAAAKDHALSQTESIDALFRTIDEIGAEARATRLKLEKMVKTRKQELRDGILMKAKQEWTEFLDGVNKGLGKVYVTPTLPDFAGAMKGKRTLETLRDAASTELARAKIETHQQADHIRASLEILRTEAKGYESLFADAQSLVMKAEDDLRAVIANRIHQHQKAEAERLEAERAKIRAEEERRAKEEAERQMREQAEAERARVRKEEAERIAQEQAAESRRKDAERVLESTMPTQQRAKPRDTKWETPTREEELRAWQKKWGLTNAAMKELFAIVGLEWRASA